MEKGTSSPGMKHSDSLQMLYGHYLDLITGRCPANRSPLGALVQSANPKALSIYRSEYIPDQILRWGGVVSEIFPETCLILKEEGHDLEEFVRFFYEQPFPFDTAYDYFKIKLDRFREFILKLSPGLRARARERIQSSSEREYRACMEAYLTFNPPD